MIVLAVAALASTACTQGNIVSDFEQPTYMVVDTLKGGVEIRRYDSPARSGEAAAERAVRRSKEEIEAATARSGLVTVLTTCGGDLGAEQQRLMAALEASPRWQVDGEQVRRAGEAQWAFLGLCQDELAVPLRRSVHLNS